MGNWKKTFNPVNQENLNIPKVIPNGSMISTFAKGRFHLEPTHLRISIRALIGNGSFGRVYKAQLHDSSEEIVALKHCYYNPKYNYREVEILMQLEDHCNIVKLHMYSYNLEDQPRSSLIMVMEYIPMNLRDHIKRYRDNQKPHDAAIYVRILSYQLFRGLGYLRSLGVCHRDIKPDNLLLDSQSMQLKVADFGNAKILESHKRNVSYVGSRLYRAPELFAKCEHYDCSIDIWSAGCVLAELLKGSPLFRSSKVELQQLHHMVSLLGTEGLDRAPKVHAVCAAKPHIVRPGWDVLLKVPVPQNLADLLNACFVYESGARIMPMTACAHGAFDELRIMDTLGIRMPNGQKLPPLFNFSDKELGLDEKIRMDLVPLHLSEM